MTFTQAIIAYAVSWWMVIFMAAPIGAAKVTDATRKKIWIIKLLATTVIAALLTWAIDITIASGIVSVR